MASVYDKAHCAQCIHSCGRLHRAGYPLKVGANDLIRHKINYSAE